MGRFESNVSHYVGYRPRYPDTFYRLIAEHLDLDGRGRLVDLGCGPGFIAIGLAPYFAEVVGIDPEAGMLDAAREEAAAANISLRLILGRAEDIGAELAPVRLATFGRSFHWMNAHETLAALDRVVEPGGALAFIREQTLAPTDGWFAAWKAARESFEVDAESRARRRGSVAEQVRPQLEGSAFIAAEEIGVSITRTWTIDDLVGRAISMSGTSPAKLGARIDAFEAAIRDAVEPFAGADGFVTEHARSEALIAVRRV